MFETKDKLKFHLLNTGALLGELYLVDLAGHKIVARVTSDGSWPIARLLTDEEIAGLPDPDEGTEAIQFDPHELESK